MGFDRYCRCVAVLKGLSQLEFFYRYCRCLRRRVCWRVWRSTDRRARQGEGGLLAEIRNTNAATVVALGICNTFLAIKKQHVKRLKETFERQKADYLARAHQYKIGELPPGNIAPPLLFDLQVLVLPPFDLPLNTLRHQIFEKISLSNRRALMLVTSLTETVHGLNDRSTTEIGL